MRPPPAPAPTSRSDLLCRPVPAPQFGTFGEAAQVNWVHIQYQVRL